MSLHPLAGKVAPQNILVDIPELICAYYSNEPDMSSQSQRVAFGTSGHRGSALNNSFNEQHIVAISQAICDYRKAQNISGPLFMGMDTHALSRPAMLTAIEVLIANDVTCMIQPNYGFTPTPAISHAILQYNRGRTSNLADGIVSTPSHNPPADGGFKYNPSHGGPADSNITQWIAKRANTILENSNHGVKRIPLQRALKSECLKHYDYVIPYVNDLKNIIDMDAIAKSGLRIGADTLGGAGLAYWQPIAEVYNLDITVAHPYPDYQFKFMSVDKDGKIRMDCSSPYAMASLIAMKDKFDISFANDTDFDRHGIVTRSVGLLNPNHYLAVAINYLFQNRAGWSSSASIGKTLVSSSMIDRVADSLQRNLCEVPVGFKWFVDGLLNGTYGFGGEESAGASFLRKDGTVWTTDKDGIILNLLAAEITAKTQKDPGEHYQNLTTKFGEPVYERIDAPATLEQKKILRKLSPQQITDQTLAGEKILAKLTTASGNNASIGGLKVVTQNGWFAARPSGTENIYKIYAESFLNKKHLKQIQQEAQNIVNKAFNK